MHDTRDRCTSAIVNIRRRARNRSRGGHAADNKDSILASSAIVIAGDVHSRINAIEMCGSTGTGSV